MMTSSRKDWPNDCDNDRLSKIPILAPKTSILLFPVVGRCRNLPGSVSSRWAWSKTPDLPLELSFYLSQFQRYKYFLFRWPHCHFRLSVIIAMTWPHFIRARPGRKCRTSRWNFDAICCGSSGITISGFGGHIAISGCRSML